MPANRKFGRSLAKPAQWAERLWPVDAENQADLELDPVTEEADVDAMIEVRDLTHYYGPMPAVENVNFTVRRGEILGFLGPNGAGKTTTMRILTGFMPPTRGTVTLDGVSTWWRNRWKCANGSDTCRNRCRCTPK